MNPLSICCHSEGNTAKLNLLLMKPMTSQFGMLAKMNLCAPQIAVASAI